MQGLVGLREDLFLYPKGGGSPGGQWTKEGWDMPLVLQGGQPGGEGGSWDQGGGKGTEHLERWHRHELGWGRLGVGRDQQLGLNTIPYEKRQVWGPGQSL